MKLPTLGSDIGAAERRIEQAKRQARENFAQVRSAIRSRLARPSSLLVATGMGALLGVWFARRNKPPVEKQGVSAWAPIVGVVSTLILRFAMQRLVEPHLRPDSPGAQHSAMGTSENT